MGGHFLNLMKGIYKISPSYLVVTIERFLLDIGIGAALSLLSPLVNIILEILISATRQEKEKKGIRMGEK